MNKMSKLIFELQESNLDEHELNNMFLDEFRKIEEELIEKLETNEEIDPNDLVFRNKLNKIVSSIFPHLIDIYDLNDQIEKEDYK